jgi:hypothetical protein
MSDGDRRDDEAATTSAAGEELCSRPPSQSSI